MDFKAPLRDGFGRLASASTDMGGTARTLVYDPLGRLFEVSNPVTGTRRFLYDGDTLVAEYNGANQIAKRHVHWPGADVPMVTYEGADLSAPLQLLADHQGSIVALADASGAAVQINRYDEYGIPGAGNGGTFQYTGQMWLPELGMYHYKARIYSPTLGRFMQTDPIGYKDQFNLYAYVGNDPVNATDPRGQKIEWVYRNGGTSRQKEQATSYLNRSQTARRTFSQLRNSPVPVRIIVDPRADQTRTYSDNSIVWNPTLATRLIDGRFQSPALALGHDTDHALRQLKEPAQYRIDAATPSPMAPPGNAGNWTVNEDKAEAASNEMARELGEPVTRNYGDIRPNEVGTVTDPTEHTPAPIERRPPR